MKRGYLIGGLLVTVALCAGCAQNVEPVQDVTTPANASQRTTQDGSEGYIYVIANNYGPLPFGQIEPGAAPSSQPAIPGVNQSGVSVTMNVGSTAATPTGATANATGSGSQNTTAEQKPETTLTIPVTVAWAGGSASGQGTAARGDATASQVNELKSEQIKLRAEADRLQAMLDAISNAASQPVTPPPGS